MADVGPSSLPNYMVFMLNRERVRSDGKLKLITVKINWAKVEEKENSFDDSFNDGTKAAFKDQAIESVNQENLKSDQKL